MEVTALKRTSIDYVGKVVLSDGKVFRLIHDNHVDDVLHILKTLENTTLLGKDIINTKISDTKLFPEYKLILEHEKLEFVTYPTEWSPLEFYDAVKFFISLLQKLKQLNLGVCDDHLFNITLNRGKFILYDFGALKKGSTTRGSMKQIWRRIAMPLLLIYAKQWEKCKLFLVHEKLVPYKEISNYLNIFDKFKYYILAAAFYILYGISSLINKITKRNFDVDVPMIYILKKFLQFYPIKQKNLQGKLKKKQIKLSPQAVNGKIILLIKSLQPKWILEFGNEKALYAPIFAAEEVKAIYLNKDQKAIDRHYAEFTKCKSLCSTNFYSVAVDFVRPTFAGRSGPLDTDENIAPLLLAFKNRLPDIDITISTAAFLKSCVYRYLHFDDIIRQMRIFAKQHLLIEFPVKKPHWPDLSWFNIDWYNTENFEAALHEHFIILKRYNIEDTNVDSDEGNLILFLCKAKI